MYGMYGLNGTNTTGYDNPFIKKPCSTSNNKEQLSCNSDNEANNKFQDLYCNTVGITPNNNSGSGSSFCCVA